MISVDTLADNKGFAEKEKADFPILANPEKNVAMAYGVIAPDAPPERQLARRWTFYIDPIGKMGVIDKAVKSAEPVRPSSRISRHSSSNAQIADERKARRARKGVFLARFGGRCVLITRYPITDSIRDVLAHYAERKPRARSWG